MRHVILPTIWFPILLGLFCVGWGYLADLTAYAQGWKDAVQKRVDTPKV